MSSVVVHMYLEPALAAMLYDLVSKYKKYVMKDDRMMLKLDKALYGCNGSAKLWYQHLKGTLAKLEFVFDPAVYCDKQWCRRQVVYCDSLCG